MGSDLEQWKRCLVKSIQLFCRNYCQYDQEAKIDGLLAITLDKKEVILVKLQEVDSDSSALRTTAKPTLEQSEQLESILRYLAPSCRLLKKAAVTPQLPTVWKPVGESLAPVTAAVSSSETPDRLTFLRSLGLAPTAVVASQIAARSACPIRLRSKSHNVHTSSMPDPDVRLNNRSVQPVVESLKVVGVSSQMPSASPRPGHIALPTAASCDGQQSSSERFLTVSTHKPREGILELIARESQLKNMKPLSIVCDKNGTNTALQQQQQLDAKVVVTTTQSAYAAQQISTNCVSNERTTGRIKKPTTHTVVHRRHIGSCSGCDGADAKPLQHPHRLKKRVNTETSSSTGSNKSTKSTHGVAVKRIKSEPKEKDDSPVDVKPTKFEGGSVSSDHPTTKTAVCKKFTKLKDRTTVVSKLKSSTATNTSDSSAANAICKRKNAAVDLKPIHRKRMNLSAKKENSVPGKHLVNKSKARLKVLYSKAANNRKERVLKALRRVRAKGCGSCSACKVKENCRTCNFCLDMKCYGGPNKLHKKCRLRQCRFIKSSCNAVSSSGATENDPDDSK